MFVEFYIIINVYTKEFFIGTFFYYIVANINSDVFTAAYKD